VKRRQRQPLPRRDAPRHRVLASPRPYDLSRLRQRRSSRRRGGPCLGPRQRLPPTGTASTRSLRPTAAAPSSRAATSPPAALGGTPGLRRAGGGRPAAAHAGGRAPRCAAPGGESYIRIIVTRGVGDCSYNFDRVQGPTVVMIQKPLPRTRRATTRRASGWPQWACAGTTTRALADPAIKSSNLLKHISRYARPSRGGRGADAPSTRRASSPRGRARTCSWPPARRS